MTCDTGRLMTVASKSCCAVLFMLLVVATSRAVAQDDDLPLLAGLRQRQLYALANAFCLDRLQDPRLTDAQRAKLVIEGMLTASQQAVYAPADARAPHWQNARQLAEKIGPEQPYRLVVELQQALLTLTQGELARQEAEATTGDGNRYTPALKLLRQAFAELETLDKKATQQEKQPPSGLSSEEWQTLRQDVQWHLARAQREQALCYPVDSSERSAMLRLANERLDNLRGSLSGEHPLVWRVKLELAGNVRLLGDAALATRMLNVLSEPPTPRPIQEQARAELARIKIQAGQLLDAYNLLMAGRAKENEPADAELEYALLETRVAQWKAALTEKDAANAERFRNDASEQLALLERTFGPYWSRRGEALVGTIVGMSGGELQLQTRSADARFAKGLFDDETLKLYDQAADAALTAKNYEKYLELASRAATVQERRDNAPAAAARCWKAATNVAERHPAQDSVYVRASEVHLHGLKLAAASAAPAGMLPKYQEHLRLWPRTKSAVEVRFLIADAYERSGDWRAALAAYEQVPNAHERAPAALQRSAALWPKYLDTLADQPKERIAESERALEYFRSLVGDPPPMMYSDVQRQAALALARLLLREPGTGAKAAQQQIEAAQQGSALASTAWQTEAQSLLVIALAAQPKQRAAASQLLAKIGSEDPRRLLDLLTTLSDSTAATSPEVRRELAKLQLEGIASLKTKSSNLSTTQRAMLPLLEAAALAGAGERAASLAAFAALLKSQPRSAPVLEWYATVLAEGGDRAALQQAREQWQLVWQASPPRSERWWRAKYQVALLSHSLGEQSVAEKLIRELEATPPGLKGTPLEIEFQALLKKAE